MNWLRGCDAWWFGRGSPAAFGVYRIALGTLAFVNLAMMLPDFDAWFTEDGFVPWAAASQWLGPDWRINVYAGITSAPVTLTLYLATMVAALLTTLGLWSRLSTIALAVGYISLHHRNPIVLHSGDTLIRNCLIILAVGPAGASCSMDRFIRLWKGKEDFELPSVSLWPQRLVQYQLALMYFTTVWHKAHGTHWREGTATWYPAQLNEFDRFGVPPFLEQQPMVALLTYATLLVEVALATLVFAKPLRKWILLMGLGLHGFIDWRYNIPLFGWIVAAGYLCFYEGNEVEQWAKDVGARFSRWKVRVLSPAGMAFSDGPVRALMAADPLQLVEYEHGAGGAWAVEGAKGPVKRPLWSVWVRTLGAWPMGCVPGLFRRLLDRAVVRKGPGL